MDSNLVADLPVEERIALDESVVCLTGVAGSKRLDTLVIANPRRDFPWFRKRDLEATKAVVGSREFGRLIDIAASGDPSALADDEILRAFWWFTHYGTILEGMFMRWREGQLSEEMWLGYERIMLGVLVSPLGKRWWDAEMTPFSHKFRSHFDSMLADSETDTSWKHASASAGKNEA